MADDIKRQTAYKCSINDLNHGVFTKRPGWESSYVMTEHGDFSRINIIAVIVSKEGNSLTLDDGTGQIEARIFDEAIKMDKLDVGSVVRIIGRPREYNNKIFLTIELIKPLNNIGWVAYRKKELSLIKKVRDMTEARMTRPKDAEIVESTTTINSRERILGLIKERDKGDGAAIDDIITLSKIKNAEDIIQDLLLRGDIFELRAGRLKVM